VVNCINMVYFFEKRLILSAVCYIINILYRKQDLCRNYYYKYIFAKQLL